jgi:hypothetical protein
MNYSVNVSLKAGAYKAGIFLLFSAFAVFCQAGKCRKIFFFLALKRNS